MKLKQIKKEMLAFRDLFGSDLLNVSDVPNAKTQEELTKIVNRHESHIEDMANDALRGVSEFRKKLDI
jgi:hypothetical protein